MGFDVLIGFGSIGVDFEWNRQMLFVCVLVALSDARRIRRRRSTNADITNPRLTHKIATLFNQSMAAYKQAGRDSIDAIRDCSNTFERYLKTVPLHTIRDRNGYKKVVDRAAFDLFQTQFYLQELSNHLLPVGDAGIKARSKDLVQEIDKTTSRGKNHRKSRK